MLFIKFLFFPDQEKSWNNSTPVWLFSVILTQNLPFSFSPSLSFYLNICTTYVYTKGYHKYSQMYLYIHIYIYTLVISYYYPQSHLSVVYFPLAQFSFHSKNLWNIIYYRSPIMSFEIICVWGLTSCSSSPTSSPLAQWRWCSVIFLFLPLLLFNDQLSNCTVKLYKSSSSAWLLCYVAQVSPEVTIQLDHPILLPYHLSAGWDYMHVLLLSILSLSCF